MRPQRNDIGDETIDPDHRQHHCDHCETGYQGGLQSRPREHLRDVLLDRSNARNGLRGVNLVNGATERRCMGDRISTRPDNEIRDEARRLRVQ